MPITTAEMSAIVKEGADALFEKLDTADADVTNPDRPSVV
ncbi:suppressor of fused domain protein [Dietzia sp. NPDC055343]